MSVTMLNVFVVPDGSEDEFLANWRETTSVFSKNMGLIETHMHRNTGEGGGDPTFKFINIATWESPEAFRDAHVAYQPAEEKMTGVKFHPAIYKSVIDVVNKPIS